MKAQPSTAHRLIQAQQSVYADVAEVAPELNRYVYSSRENPTRPIRPFPSLSLSDSSHSVSVNGYSLVHTHNVPYTFRRRHADADANRRRRRARSSNYGRRSVRGARLWREGKGREGEEEEEEERVG